MSEKPSEYSFDEIEQKIKIQKFRWNSGNNPPSYDDLWSTTAPETTFSDVYHGSP